ncbi:MAG: ribonucleotide-diphosphate reductase subunit beta [Solirubrobacterales bacterium]
MKTQTNESLELLLDADIDQVMAGLDRIVEAAPSYEKLFSRWENQGWNSEDIDFSQDAVEWTSGVWNEDQKEFLQWSLSSFFLGEERVTTELLPFAIAAPSHESRLFLATQISDEARHTVFFDRFYREVFGSDAQSITENLKLQRPQMNEQWGELFDGILHDCAETLRMNPGDTAAMVRGVTVYMIVIEGTLALTGARFLLRYLKEQDLMPGFRLGFTNVNRDESRHVGFGVKYLADAIRQDPANAAIVADTIKETLPVGTLALAPPMVDDPYDFVTPFGYESGEIYAYAAKSLSKKLAAIGLDPAMID